MKQTAGYGKTGFGLRSRKAGLLVRRTRLLADNGKTWVARYGGHFEHMGLNNVVVR